MSNEAMASMAAGAGVARSDGLNAEETARLTDDIVAALKSVYDPEIPADVYELGLIYRIDIGDDRAVAIDMPVLTEVLERLRAAGLESLPGGGAEIFDEDVRSRITDGHPWRDERCANGFGPLEPAGNW